MLAFLACLLQSRRRALKNTYPARDVFFSAHATSLRGKRQASLLAKFLLVCLMFCNAFVKQLIMIVWTRVFLAHVCIAALVFHLVDGSSRKEGLQPCLAWHMLDLGCLDLVSDAPTKDK